MCPFPHKYLRLMYQSLYYLLVTGHVIRRKPQKNAHCRPVRLATNIVINYLDISMLERLKKRINGKEFRWEFDSYSEELIFRVVVGRKQN